MANPKPVTEKELLGISTVPVLRKEAKPQDVPGQKKKRPAIIGVIQEGQYIEKEHKWGLINQEVVDKVLETAERQDNGDIICHLPEPKEKEIEKGITWVNYL